MEQETLMKLRNGQTKETKTKQWLKRILFSNVHQTLIKTWSSSDYKENLSVFQNIWTIFWPQCNKTRYQQQKGQKDE